MMKYWILGLPATFATKGELAWKKDIEATLSKFSPLEPVVGITLIFFLPVASSTVNSKDVDNLCEPVFSVIVNKLGWFGGMHLKGLVKKVAWK